MEFDDIFWINIAFGVWKMWLSLGMIHLLVTDWSWLIFMSPHWSCFASVEVCTSVLLVAYLMRLCNCLCVCCVQ